MNVLKIVDNFLIDLCSIMEREKSHSKLLLIHKLYKNMGQDIKWKEIEVNNNLDDIVEGIYKLTKEDYQNLITPEKLKFMLYNYNDGFPIYELFCIKKERW